MDALEIEDAAETSVGLLCLAYAVAEPLASNPAKVRVNVSPTKCLWSQVHFLSVWIHIKSFVDAKASVGSWPVMMAMIRQFDRQW